MSDNLEPRVSVLENSVSTLSEDVRLLYDAVKEQGLQLSKGFSDLGEKMRDQTKPNWGNIIAGIGLVIVLVGAILAPVWMSFNNVRNRIEDNQNAIASINSDRLVSAYDKGKLETKIDSLKAEIDNVEQRLKMHMASGNNHPEGVISQINELKGQLLAIKSTLELLTKNK